MHTHTHLHTSKITVKSGGLKLLQITDNGHGIKLSDFEIVCERFTTSKLSTFDDLKKISTYGFRGEALASITHVSHLSITSRTEGSRCAYKAFYSDGKLASISGSSAEPKPCAGNFGTTITVEDLFYNVVTRRKALKSASEEFSRVYDVVSRYAVHNSCVSFVLRKDSQSMPELRTYVSGSILDNIRAIFGASVGRELLELKLTEKTVNCVADNIEKNGDEMTFSISGYVSNANYSVKKGSMLLFINHRLVESAALKRALDSTYSFYLPKHTHPFIYLSLHIAPHAIDVNVHPTKREVHFLHEGEVIEAVQKTVEDQLLGSNASRTFYTQSLLPGAILSPGTNGKRDVHSSNDDVDSSQSSSGNPNTKVGGIGSDTKKKKVGSQPRKMIRTDHRSQTLERFLKPIMDEETSINETGVESEVLLCDNDEEEDFGGSNVQADCNATTKSSKVGSVHDTVTVVGRSTKHQMPRKPILLTSVLEAQDEIISQEMTSLREILKRYTFVGCVDASLVLVQHATEMYLINVTTLSTELFRQLVFTHFANHAVLRLEEPIYLQELLLLALDDPECEWTEEDGLKSEIAHEAELLLASKATMLGEYFGISVDAESRLCALPLLIDDYVPDLDGMPMFLLRLATMVIWDEERACFDSIAAEIARFYAVQAVVQYSSENDETNDRATKEERQRKWVVEHVIFPSLRANLRPGASFADNGSIVQVASLPALYRVFERC